MRVGQVTPCDEWKPQVQRCRTRLEGMDNYLIVQTESTTEVRLISRAAHE